MTHLPGNVLLHFLKSAHINSFERSAVGIIIAYIKRDRIYSLSLIQYLEESMIKRKVVLGAAIILLVSFCLWSSPGFSELNVVIRDSKKPCKPYASSKHDFGVVVFNCDFTPIAAKWLTGVGPGGGKIYGEVKVPQGSYLIVGVATCKNVWTNWAYVNACCGKEVCVNLIPRRFQQCAVELQVAIRAALILPGYSFSSPQVKVSEEMRKALERADGAIEDLKKYLPKYEFDIPFEAIKDAEESSKQLLELFKKAQRIRVKR
jgi:hypothetical protein